MTRFVPSRSLLAAFCLLTCTQSADAGCAWVLWTQTDAVNVTPGEPIDVGEWWLEAAVPTYDGGDDAAKQRAQRMAERGLETNVKSKEMRRLIGGGFSVTTKLKEPEQGAFTNTFRCFPDTVDPRRPGAK